MEDDFAIEAEKIKVDKLIFKVSDRQRSASKDEGREDAEKEERLTKMMEEE